MKTIAYFMTPVSPWSYLGHERVLQIAAKHHAQIELLPFELGAKIFPQTGGLPLLQRAPQRQAYRLTELARWSAYLNVPMNVQPKHFPVSDALALQAIAAAQCFALPAQVLAFTGALMRAVWVNQLNVADPEVINSIAIEQKIDPTQLVAHSAAGRARLDSNNQAAVAAEVFGAPWFVYTGEQGTSESFWGQDRLEFLDRALA